MRFGSALSSLRTKCLAVVSLVAALGLSQAALAPAALGQASAAADAGPALSRFDIYAGYGYFYPFASDINNVSYPSVPLGAVGSFTGYFGRHFGLQLEGNYSPNGKTDNNCVYTAQAGPIVRWQYGRVVPFFHVIGGGAIVGGPRAQDCGTVGFGGTGGGGVDIILPIFHDRLALRPVQVDALYAYINNGDLAGGGLYGGVGKVTAVRGSAGIVLRLGTIGPAAGKVPPTLNCSTEPGAAFPGDPISVSASTLNINPKRKPRYLWSVSGGKISGDGAVAAIDTTSLQPGSFEVTGKLVEGDKQKLVAACTTSFTLKPYDPPAIACTADKSAIHSGDPVAITAHAVSPQNRPLTYTYATTAGLVTGSGPAASLTTVGLSPGSITVSCQVADDKGQVAKATASVVVTAIAPPPTPILPTTQALCGITFDRDKRRPDRVDNEAKGCLDDVALTLNRETADKLLIVGAHVEKENNRNAAERAMNAAEYLTKEKGVDPARLDLRTGPDNSRSVAMMLVPPGAAIDAAGATSFDTSSVKRTGQAYGVSKAKTAATAKPRAKPRKKRKKKPAPLTIQ